MKLFIPPIGTVLTLTQPWSFEVMDERRNTTFLDAVGWTSSQDGMSRWYRTADQVPKPPAEMQAKFGKPRAESKGGYWYECFYPFTLPAGTVLKVDRLYIRKGDGDYDSLTFFIMDCPDKRFAPKKAGGKLTGQSSARFWVKLHDANKIECEVKEDGQQSAATPVVEEGEHGPSGPPQADEAASAAERRAGSTDL